MVKGCSGNTQGVSLVGLKEIGPTVGANVPYLELGYRMWTRVVDESDLSAVVGV